MPYPRSEAKVFEKMKRVRELEETIGAMLLEVDRLKEDIGKYMDEKNLKTLELSHEDTVSQGSLVAKKHERATVTYDVDRLKSKLDRDVFMEVVDRTYTVTDINEMIKLVKGAGINAVEFKGLLNVTQKPNNAKIKFLYDSGELTMDNLKGCFTAKITKSIKVVDGQGGEN